MNVLGTDYLFPLTKLSTALTGYFIDKEGQVYSTKGSKGLQRLQGSQPQKYGPRYFTLANRTYVQSSLIEQAKAHPDFKAETTPAPAPVKTAAFPGSKASTTQSFADVLRTAQAVNTAISRPTITDYAKTTDEALTGRGSMIAAIKNGAFVFDANPVIYTSVPSLKSEMERLAKANPGVRYVSFTITGSVVAGAVDWS